MLANLKDSKTKLAEMIVPHRLNPEVRPLQHHAIDAKSQPHIPHINQPLKDLHAGIGGSL